MSVVKKCVFNCHIDCEDHNKCSGCGWNPEVEKARKEKLQQKYMCEAEKEEQINDI